MDAAHSCDLRLASRHVMDIGQNAIWNASLLSVLAKQFRLALMLESVCLGHVLVILTLEEPPKEG